MSFTVKIVRLIKATMGVPSLPLVKIIICGKSGAGMTSLFNAILGRDLHCDRNTTAVNQTQTAEFHFYHHTHTCSLIVCDTPGYTDKTTIKAYVDKIKLDLQCSNVILFCIPAIENVEDIKYVIEEILTRHPGINGIIFALTKADIKGIRSRNFPLNIALPEVLGTMEIPVVATTLLGNEIPEDECATPWLARLLYEILDQKVGGTERYFPSLARCHPYLDKESLCLEEIREECSNSCRINRQPTHRGNSPPVERVSLIERVRRATESFSPFISTGAKVGATVGATIGALAIGISTFGAGASVGATVGGAIGAKLGRDLSQQQAKDEDKGEAEAGKKELPSKAAIAGATVAGATVAGASAGVVGASVGSTVGAIALGVPTLGLGAGVGLALGGAVGGAFGSFAAWLALSKDKNKE